MHQSTPFGIRIAVVLPCFNEHAAIAKTIEGFRSALPEATIYVYDNGSTDATSQIGTEHGATVRLESRPGKGNVIRRAFADIDADIYVVADGDATYDPTVSREMARLVLQDSVDMVTAVRRHDDAAAYRSGHVLGNRLFTRVVGRLFEGTVSDVFSGYRAFSRRFVKSFPTGSRGFEIESEMTVHALQLRMPVAEVSAAYAKRVEGSQSKLSTYRDGWRILMHILRLERLLNPREFFGFLGMAVGLLAVGFAAPLIVTYVEIGQVPRLPTAVLVTGMVITASLLWVLGVVLESVSQVAFESRRLAYLSVSAPSDGCRPPGGQSGPYDDPAGGVDSLKEGFGDNQEKYSSTARRAPRRRHQTPSASTSGPSTR